jgi:hypothetical protein
LRALARTPPMPDVDKKPHWPTFLTQTDTQTAPPLLVYRRTKAKREAARTFQT